MNSLVSNELASAPFYVRGQILNNLDEDRNHEFKAHRQLSDLDLSGADTVFGRFSKESVVSKMKIKRRSLSPYICGMLNTRERGRMFLGVTDQGYVSGFMLSSYQMDHFELALADLLARYTPPVPAEAVRIAFVPVKESAGDKHRVDPLGFRTKPNRRHVLRNSRYCWCDLNSLAALEKGGMYNFYVIEIIFMPAAATSPTTVVYDNEQGKAFMRGFGSNRKLRGSEIARIKNGVGGGGSIGDCQVLSRPVDSSDTEEPQFKDEDFFSLSE